jgi:hypothetical protein
MERQLQGVYVGEGGNFTDYVLIDGDTIVFGSTVLGRASAADYEIDTFDYRNSRIVFSSYGEVSVSRMNTESPSLSESTFGDYTKYSSNPDDLQALYDAQHEKDFGVSGAEYDRLVEEASERAESSGAGSLDGGSSSEWEENAQSATQKLLEGRTDLTQDEYDAFKQSESEYDDTH